MKKLFLLLFLSFVFTTLSHSQTWFQSSIEHKLNYPAGLSVSNEVGYDVFSYDKFIFSPSVDWTYYPSPNLNTENLLFFCINSTVILTTVNNFSPYVIVSGGYLINFENSITRASGFGKSFQVGVSYNLTTNSKFFYQFRHAKYPKNNANLTQFGLLFFF